MDGDPRFYIVGRGGEGIIGLSKYGWRGEAVTWKASSFKSEDHARKALKRAAKWREPPPADVDIICGMEEANKIASVRFQEAIRKKLSDGR